MNPKFVLFFVFLILSVSSSDAVDVKCVDEGTINTCFIKETIMLESGDSLNIIGVSNTKEVITICFTAESTSKIVSFPSNIFEQFPSVENVVFANVSMETFVGENLRNAEKLYLLNVTLNKIQRIPANAIFLASKLELLYLSGNEISVIEDYAFNSSSLRELHLSQNKLKSIKRYTFSNASQCEVIDLSANLIENIEEGAFGLPELSTIILDKNKLRTLPLNLFTNTPTLLRLSMGANQFSTDIVPALEKASGLMDLYMYDNPSLSGVHLSFLKQFPNLKTLDLSNTNLTSNTIADLHDLPKLAHLSLTRNNLNDSNLLHHLRYLKSLKRLHIQQNKLTTLNDFNQITSIIPSLWSIEVNDNPWDHLWIESARKICQVTSVRCYGMQ